MKTRLKGSLVLPLLILSLAATCPVLAVPVTFQVNLSLQTSLGNFNPGSDTVEVHGSFDGWGAGAVLAASQTNAEIYQATVDVTGAEGATVEYKFVINQGGTLVWENNGVGANGAQNRSFTLPASAETLPVVFFNNQEGPPGITKVTFQVDMTIQRGMGNFDPTNDTMEAHGSFDSWGGGIMLSASSTNENIYQGVAEISGSPGAPFEYKFVINKAGTQVYEGNVGPGGGFGNRTLILASGEQVLPVVYFDNLSSDPGAPVPVTFRVNMAVQTALGQFDPASGTMFVAGQFNNWSTSETPLTNSAAEPNLYTGTVQIKAAAGTAVPFKFVANGGTWESGDNRTFSLQPPSQTLPILFFNNQADLGSLSIVRSSATELTVSWTASATARLQTAANLAGVWQDVPDALGAASITVPLGSTNAFFRLIAP